MGVFLGASSDNKPHRHWAHQSAIGLEGPIALWSDKTRYFERGLWIPANGWQTFWQVTLPNIRWGLLYGVLLCNARAMGEFGAVSVVSGHIRGETNTVPTNY
ncbi:MAG: ABC-type tungstate transport system substrate-binding protein [Zhongshania sp.]|jgi:ABC-type tungstate transport system substrate-binding protein